MSLHSALERNNNKKMKLPQTSEVDKAMNYQAEGQSNAVVDFQHEIGKTSAKGRVTRAGLQRKKGKHSGKDKTQFFFRRRGTTALTKRKAKN